MNKFNRTVTHGIVSVFLFLCAGCVQNKYPVDGRTSFSNNQIAEKERILLKTKNYESLIAINRESLKKKEDADVRFKLSNYYFLSGNFNSSLHYLSVLLKKNPSVDVYILQSKNLMAQKKYDKALVFINMALQKVPNHAEGFNLRGVILAEKGDLKGASRSFSQARNAFYPEEKVLNNMALVHIAERQYAQAIQILLPIYLRGYRDKHLTNNLIFALVKTGDLRYAKEIIKRDNISLYPDRLVSALFELDGNNSAG